jgi:hypothetical protein
MSVIERSTSIQPLERAVFVTDDDRRARWLRRGAFMAIALVCLWLVGLGLGMFGFGSLPGVSLITPGHDGKQRSDAPAQQAGGEDVAPLSRSVNQRRLVVRQDQARGIPRANASQGAAAAARRSRLVTTPAVVAPPGQLTVNPAQRQRGWARKGLAAPPGQLQTPPPPPPTSRGQRRGQQTTTTTTTTPLPPGQAKKTPPPPPPPA